VARTLHSTLSGGGQVLVPLAENLVDGVWAADRPAPPKAAMRVHPLRWAGSSVAEKLARVRGEMVKQEAAVLVVPQLDEVAWLLNVRGADVDYNPVTVAYVLVHADPADGAVLFCDGAKVTPEVEAHLKEAGVKVQPYTAITHALHTAAAAGKRVMGDPAKVSLALFDAVTDAAEGGGAGRSKARRKGEKKGNGASAPEEATSRTGSPLVECASPVAMAKAVKNAAELGGMREAHLRDACALAAFFAWLEATVGSAQAVSEAYAAEHLQSLRAQQEGFLEPSFPTIAGCNANGAIIHYRPVEGTCAAVTPNSLLLLDSGGQYDCGTTDVTRTVFLGDGQPSGEQVDAFTRVLQGHIALDTAVFPENTPGFVLDVFARRQLWQVGLDYRHGTGHGVGAALNVHEGPQGISPRFGNTTGLVEGMIVSNEPGYYADGRFGIRIENLLAIKEAATESRFGGVTFLGFERLTLVPIQAKMLAPHLLTDAEIAWLDEYHAQCWREVSPRLKPGPALDWLRVNTQPIRARMASAQPARAR
jgi:Xaa-Pro aminopeptidase